MAEKMNLKAKCLRYRGFFQWMILGILVVVLVRYGGTDIYPAILGSEVKEIDGNDVNMQREGDKLRQMQIEEKKNQATENQIAEKPEEPEKKPEEVEKKPEPTPAPPPPPLPSEPQERQRAKEVDHQKQDGQQEPKEESLRQKETNVQQFLKEEQKPAAQSGSYRYPFLDPNKAWNERVDDLVNRLTIEQVILHM